MGGSLRAHLCPDHLVRMCGSVYLPPLIDDTLGHLSGVGVQTPAARKTGHRPT